MSGSIVRDLIFVPAGTGGYDGDRYYTPGGLLEVGGYLANTAHRIGEWTAVGGTITLSAPEVIAQTGLDLRHLRRLGRLRGRLYPHHELPGRDGRTYNINTRRGDMTFYGLGNGFVRKSDRWGVTQVWTNPFGKGREVTRWEDGYTVGRDAGRLDPARRRPRCSKATSSPTSCTATRQIDARPDGVTDGYKLGQNQVAQAGTLLVGPYGSLWPHGRPRHRDR